MKIVIATCDKYKDRTIPIILASLREANITDDEIVISCNSIKNNTTTFDNVIMYSYNCELYEHVAFKTCLFIQDDMFFLHDTCKVSSDFKLSINSFNYESYDSVMLTSAHTSCGMGFYRYSYIETKKDYILSLKNMIKDEAITLENSFFGGRIGSFTSKPAKILAAENSIYGGPNKRIIEIYNPPGVIKYKANWGANNGSAGYFTNA